MCIKLPIANTTLLCNGFPSLVSVPLQSFRFQPNRQEAGAICFLANVACCVNGRPSAKTIGQLPIPFQVLQTEWIRAESLLSEHDTEVIKWLHLIFITRSESQLVACAQGFAMASHHWFRMIRDDLRILNLIASQVELGSPTGALPANQYSLGLCNRPDFNQTGWRQALSASLQTLLAV